jgi:hypothetical protein
MDPNGKSTSAQTIAALRDGYTSWLRFTNSPSTHACPAARPIAAQYLAAFSSFPRESSPRRRPNPQQFHDCRLAFVHDAACPTTASSVVDRNRLPQRSGVLRAPRIGGMPVSRAGGVL